MAAAGLAVAVLAAVGLGSWSLTHPTALNPVGDAVEMPVPIGGSGVIGMFPHPTSGDVRLRGAEPVIRESAGAAVRVLLCGNRTRPGSPVLGAVAGPAERACATTGPPRDTTLAPVSPRTPYLVIEVTPRAPGTVVVEGLRVRYRDGLQRGEQQSGVKVTVRTPAGS